MSESAPISSVAVVVEIDAADLPLHCPGPHTRLWDLHPRVYLDISAQGEARCPYCGTLYKLRNPGALKAHH
jgi:uncharacterized Zn-finger protein